MSSRKKALRLRRQSRPAVSCFERMEDRTLLTTSAIGLETLVNISTAGTQTTGPTDGRSMAVAPDNSYVTVWSSSLGDGSGYGVYARRFAVDGTPLSGEILVNTTTANDQLEPAVAVAADGRFAVAWQSQGQDGAGLAIVVRQFAANGTPLSGELIANTTTVGNQQAPALAYLTGGGFVVTWSGRGVGDTTGVFGRVSNATGTALTGAEFRINNTTANTQSNQSVAADGAGGFAVAWSGEGAGDSSGVFFRRFNNAGVALTAESLVNEETGGTQEFPSLARRSDGSFLVAWSGNGAGDTQGVFVRRISAAAVPIGSAIQVNQSTDGIQQTPSVTANGTSFVVAWQGSGASDTNGVYFRGFNASGIPSAAETRVNTTIAGTQQRPTVATLNGGFGGYVVAWSGNGPGDSTGIYTQRYTNYNFVVNSLADTVDVNPGNGIVADSTGARTLRAAIMEANALNLSVPVLITLSSGNYNLSIAGKSEDGAAMGDLDIKSRIEIVGNSATATTINGNSLDRVFQVLPGASLTLRKLKITGGDATGSDAFGGGGIAAQNASLLTSDVTIAGNKALSDNDNYGGGGVQVNGGTTLIRNTTFTGNIANRATPRAPGDTSNDSAGYGAGLYAEGAKVDILNSTFTNNKGHEGGAIANIGGSVMSIVSSTLNANSTDGQGGGIQNELATLSVVSSTISKNTAPSDGGGLYNFAGIVTVNGTTFTGNTSGDSGGGIENTGRATAAIGQVTVTNSTFSGNSAKDGGALNNSRDSVMSVTDSSITGNSSTEAGGGISNYNLESFAPGSLSVLRTTIANNTSQYGGGLLSYKNSTDIRNSTIKDNSALSGGGVFNLEGGVMTIADSQITGNKATAGGGGGIDNELSPLTITNTNVSNNTVTNDGGGLFNFGGVVDITGSNFSGNSSPSEGGGIENTGRITAAIGEMHITNTTISGNSSEVGAGVDNKRDSIMTITDSSISNNTASVAGGGVGNQNTESFGPGHLTLLRTTVENNSAGQYGGGLFGQKNVTEIIDSIFSGNLAHEGGAIDNIDAAVMSVTGTDFIGNSTDHEGGALQNELSQLTVTDSNFADNHADDDGGALFNYAGAVTVSGSSFTGNSAGRVGGAIENTGRSSAAIGTMDISNSTFNGNSAQDGGGLDNKRDSTMNITDSTITGNQASGNGGGISNEGTASFGPGLLNILRSTISYNTASLNGGGVYTTIGVTTILNSTIAGNTAQGAGGGVANTTGGTTSLVNATVAYNTANLAGGIYTDAGTFNLANSLVAKNTATTANPDAGGAFTSGGFNLIGIIGSATGLVNGVSGDMVGTSVSPVDPLLGALQNNGGPTETIALLAGSQAIDEGSNSIASSNGLTTDQRGLLRLKDGDGNGSIVIDIGAFER